MPARTEEWTSLLRMTISKWPARSTGTSAGGANLQTRTTWFLGQALYYLRFSISSTGTTIRETDRVWTGLICTSSTHCHFSRGVIPSRHGSDLCLSIVRRKPAGLGGSPEEEVQAVINIAQFFGPR